MKRLSWRVAVPAAAVLAASLAVAGNVHLKQNRNPVFNDQGLTLHSVGGLTGLGNLDLRIRLTATGNPTATCTNPSGGSQPPGQNPAQVNLTGVQDIPADAVKNGNVVFDVVTAGPQTPIPGAPGCPNTKWTERITDVAFTSSNMVVEQPPGTTVMTLSCTFSPPTVNGQVLTSTVTCS